MYQYLIAKNQELNNQSSNLNHSGLGMLLVIDRHVDDIKTLVDGVRTGAKVLVLNSETDSIEQITTALAKETFSSLHLVSHGAPGVLYLGKSPLTLDNLHLYSYQLQEWRVPEILLYGCNVAAGDAGSEFIERLHQLTGANIAASATKTGNSALGGDWNLEVQTNQQPVNLAFSESAMAQYSYSLAEFTDSSQLLGNSSSFGLDLADLDGDGDLDTFVANNNQPNKVWVNDGDGSFTDSGQSLGNSASLSLDLADLDGDSDVDAFVTNHSQPNKVWLNDGEGTFIDSEQSLGNFRSWGVELEDLDGDGDVDAFVSNKGSNKIWLNDGEGTFTDSGQSLGNFWSIGVELGDLDGDGDVDAFVSNFNSGNKVWLNDGEGTFTDSGQSLGNSLSTHVGLSDFDGDGDLDALVTNRYGTNPSNNVWLNDGDGNFTIGQSLGSSDSWSLDLGDLDENGSIDAFVGNLNQPNKVWLNEAAIPPIPTIEGTPEDDFLEGTPEDEIITGIAGSDFLIGDGGNDIIEGGEGFDSIEAGAGNDIIDGGAGGDLIFGDAGDDRMIGSLGVDFFEGGEGEDVADYSNLGAAITFDADTIVDKGEAGIDEIFEVETIIGASGQANTINGSTEVNQGNSFSINLENNSMIIDNGENSIVYTVENFLNASANSEDDVFIGNDADNLLIGHAGTDFISGQAGADTLIGVDAKSATPGAGERDNLNGGADADIFILGDEDRMFYLDENGFLGNHSMALILDFESGLDKIQLSGVADDYVTRGSLIYADEGSSDGVVDSGDDMIAYVLGGFNADDMIFV